MADHPGFALTLLRTAMSAVIDELKYALARAAMKCMIWLAVGILSTLAIGTCVVLGVISLGNALLAGMHQWVVSAWLADLVVGIGLLLIPIILLAVLARRMRSR